MKNKNWGWWTAWFNLIGQFAIVAGIDYAAAGFINATILDRITGGTFNTVLCPPHVLNGQLITMGVILLIQLGMNIAGINLVAILNQVSVWWHIVIVAAVVVLVLATGKPDQSGLTLGAIQPLDTAGSWDNNLGFIHLQLRRGDHLPGVPRVPVLAPPGELDVHGLRRLRPRRRGDRRRADGERVGRLPVGRGAARSSATSS